MRLFVRRICSPSTAWALSLGVFFSVSTAHGQEDFAISNARWNGTSELLEIANAEGVVVDTPLELTLDALQPSDGLLILYPDEPLPAAGLTRFIRDGGRVALADDFGEGQAFLEVFGIHRGAVPADDTPRLRGNPELLVTHAKQRHPLTTGAEVLVTNHPAGLRHAELTALYGFGETSEALVLTGAVERGRLVAISDPSVLINNMLGFQGNRRFAGNLLQYLGGRGGRVYVIGPGARLLGESGSGSADARRRLNDWLAAAAAADIPPLAFTLASFLVVVILAIFGISGLPLRSPYRADLLTMPSGGGGFAGRVAFSAEHVQHLVHAALVYKFELEAALTESLALVGQPLLRDVERAARERGLGEADVSALRALLLRLGDLRRTIDHPPGPPRISPKELRGMVETGERVLSVLSSV